MPKAWKLLGELLSAECPQPCQCSPPPAGIWDAAIATLPPWLIFLRTAMLGTSRN